MLSILPRNRRDVHSTRNTCSPNHAYIVHTVLAAAVLSGVCGTREARVNLTGNADDGVIDGGYFQLKCSLEGVVLGSTDNKTISWYRNSRLIIPGKGGVVYNTNEDHPSSRTSTYSYYLSAAANADSAGRYQCKLRNIFSNVYNVTLFRDQEPNPVISGLQNKTVLRYHPVNITFTVQYHGFVNIVGTRIRDSKEIYENIYTFINGTRMFTIPFSSINYTSDGCFLVRITIGETDVSGMECWTVKGPPAAPKSVRVVESNNSVQVVWIKPKSKIPNSDLLEGYYVRSRDGNTTWIEYQSGAMYTSYTIEDSKSCFELFVEVLSRGENFNSSWTKASPYPLRRRPGNNDFTIYYGSGDVSLKYQGLEQKLVIYGEHRDEFCSLLHEKAKKSNSSLPITSEYECVFIRPRTRSSIKDVGDTIIECPTVGLCSGEQSVYEYCDIKGGIPDDGGNSLSGNGDGLSGGAIAGIVVGVVIAVAILILCIIYCVKKLRIRGNNQIERENENPDLPHEIDHGNNNNNNVPFRNGIDRPSPHPQVPSGDNQGVQSREETSVNGASFSRADEADCISDRPSPNEMSTLNTEEDSQSTERQHIVPSAPERSLPTDYEHQNSEVEQTMEDTNLSSHRLDDGRVDVHRAILEPSTNTAHSNSGGEFGSSQSSLSTAISSTTRCHQAEASRAVTTVTLQQLNEKLDGLMVEVASGNKKVSEVHDQLDDVGADVKTVKYTTAQVLNTTDNISAEHLETMRDHFGNGVMQALIDKTRNRHGDEVAARKLLHACEAVGIYGAVMDVLGNKHSEVTSSAESLTGESEML